MEPVASIQERPSVRVIDPFEDLVHLDAINDTLDDCREWHAFVVTKSKKRVNHRAFRHKDLAEEWLDSEMERLGTGYIGFIANQAICRMCRRN